jgi:hypothetical protein
VSALIVGVLRFGSCEDAPVEGDAGVQNMSSQVVVIKLSEPKPSEAYTTCLTECEQGNAAERDNQRHECSGKSSRAKK